MNLIFLKDWRFDHEKRNTFHNSMKVGEKRNETMICNIFGWFSAAWIFQCDFVQNNMRLVKILWFNPKYQHFPFRILQEAGWCLNKIFLSLFNLQEGIWFFRGVAGRFEKWNIFSCTCPNRSGVGAIDNSDRLEQVFDC